MNTPNASRRQPDVITLGERGDQEAVGGLRETENGQNCYIRSFRNSFFYSKWTVRKREYTHYKDGKSIQNLVEKFKKEIDGLGNFSQTIV
jgi:hypothetical protein